MKRTSFFIAGFLVAASFFGVVQVANGAGTSSKLIYGCSNAKTGLISNVSTKASKCGKGYSAISWNIQGIQGASGASGSQGAKGEQGSPGQSGAKGDTGLQGAPGSPGLNGGPGIQGLPGEQGLQGLPGPAGGPKGDQGVPGPGALQIVNDDGPLNAKILSTSLMEGTVDILLEGIYWRWDFVNNRLGAIGGPGAFSSASDYTSPFFESDDCSGVPFYFFVGGRVAPTTYISLNLPVAIDTSPTISDEPRTYALPQKTSKTFNAMKSYRLLGSCNTDVTLAFANRFGEERPTPTGRMWSILPVLAPDLGQNPRLE